jgi:molecular chaperone GrpE
VKKKKNMETDDMLDQTEQSAEVESVTASANGEQAPEKGRTVAELEKLLAEEQRKSLEYLDALQRAQADFRNLKRRTENERATIADETKEKVIKKILPVVDDFERALQTVSEDMKTSPWVTGVQLVEKKLKTFLESERVAEIPSLDQPFDPNLHEAVQIDEDSSGDKDYVSDVYQKGYKIGDKVIRPAVVKVSKR